VIVQYALTWPRYMYIFFSSVCLKTTVYRNSLMCLSLDIHMLHFLIIISDCPIRTDFLTALSLNTFVQSKWRKLSMISWNLVDMKLVLSNNQNMEWLKALHLSPLVATKSATYVYQVIDTLSYSYRLLFLDIRNIYFL
jgi:hypothetical protein